MTRRAAAILAVVALAGVPGCADDEGSEKAAGEGVDRTPLVSVADSLCRAADEAATDTQTARVTFFAEAHGGLHTLANALTDIDRKAAGDLLRAKQAVEEALATSLEPAPELDAALADLHATTRAGLALLDVTAGPCPPPSSGPPAP